MAKLIIAGCRWYTPDAEEITLAIVASGYTVTEVVSGRCPTGVDAAGEAWAKERGYPVQPFPADWKKQGKSAGPKRNAEMATYADALLAFWDGHSRGTADMIRKMTVLGKPVWVEMVQPIPDDDDESTAAV